MQTWWFNANGNGSPGWNWEQFFSVKGRSLRGYCWGGPTWIKSNTSRSRIRDIVPGDLVVAYQARVGIVGLVRIASNGVNNRAVNRFNKVYLRERGRVCFQQPIPLSAVKQLPAARTNIEFVSFHQGTVFKVTPRGRYDICLLAAIFNPDAKHRCIRLAYAHH